MRPGSALAVMALCTAPPARGAALEPRAPVDEAAALVKQLGDGDERKVSAALDGLRKLGAAGVAGLVQATKHKQCWVRAGAWRWLGELGPAALPALPALVEAQPRAPRGEWASSREVGFGLGMQSATVQILVKGIPFDLRSSDKSKEEVARQEKNVERISALVALGKVGAADPAALLPSIEKAALPLDQGYCDLHAGFAIAVAEGGDKGWDAVERGLKSPSVQVQAASLLACSVRSTDTGKLADDIVRLLGSTDAGVRGLAAEALFRVNHPGESVRARLVELCQDPSPFARVLAARSAAFACNAVDAAVPVLVAALEDKSAFVRAAAADGLAILAEEAAKDRKIPGGVRPKSAVQPLTKRLNDDETDVRRRAADALGNYGELAQPALPALRKLMKHPQDTVRGAAERAVDAIEKS